MVRKTERALTDLREQTADTFFSDLGTVALVIEGSDPGITEDIFLPTARCIQNTKKRQLVTRSSLQRLRCCACHLHHEQAMRAACRVRQFFAKVLKKVQHYRVDVLALDVNAAAYKHYKRQEYQDLYNSSVVVMLEKCNGRSTGTVHFRADFILIIRQIITILSFVQQIVLIVASWPFCHGESRLEPEL